MLGSVARCLSSLFTKLNLKLRYFLERLLNWICFKSFALTSNTHSMNSLTHLCFKVRCVAFDKYLPPSFAYFLGRNVVKLSYKKSYMPYMLHLCSTDIFSNIATTTQKYHDLKSHYAMQTLCLTWWRSTLICMPNALSGYNWWQLGLISYLFKLHCTFFWVLSSFIPFLSVLPNGYCIQNHLFLSYYQIELTIWPHRATLDRYLDGIIVVTGGWFIQK